VPRETRSQTPRSRALLPEFHVQHRWASPDQTAQQTNTGSSRYESIATCRGNALMPQRYLVASLFPGLLRSMHMASVVLNAGYTNLNSSMVPDANRIGCRFT